MSDQTKLILSGVASAAVARFALHKDYKTAALIGALTIAAIAIVRAPNVEA
jgi:hypothetical protein